MWAPDLFTLNNYVVIRHADINSHSSTYFLVTNIFIRILNVLIHSHSRSYDFYSTLAFFIQHSLICKIHKFRIPSLWTINFFFTNMFIHIRDIYSITFNDKICYSIRSSWFNSFNILRASLFTHHLIPGSCLWARSSGNRRPTLLIWRAP